MDMELHKLNSTYYIQSTVLCSAAEIEFLLPHKPILNDFSHFSHEHFQTDICF